MLGAHVGRRGPRGEIGEVEKNRPDTYYIQSSDRWLTTTGASGEACVIVLNFKTLKDCPNQPLRSWI